MNLVIDNRKVAINYIDTYNLQFANNADIIKLVNEDNDNPNITLAKLIGISKGLNDSDIELLTIIYNNIDNTNIKNIKDKYDKSISTFNRCLNSLEEHNIIRVISNIIVIDKRYNIRIDNDKSKFIVIELKPNETSKGIDIF